MRKKAENEMGITLIALIVTIIVLIILASISIGTLTGKNGIIGQSKDAKEQTEIAEERETIQISAVQAAELDRYGYVTEENLRNQLDKNIGKGKYELNVIEEKFEITYVESNRSYYVDKDGNIENKEELTPEEAAKIIDGIVTDDGILAETAGGTVKFKENDLYIEDFIQEIDMEDAKIITQNGIRKKVYNCFVDNGGKVYTWGDNNYGQLGNGTYEDTYEPICISETQEVLKEKKIINIYTNKYTIVALDSDGKVYTWGYNYSGQLGNGTNQDSNIPICISDIENSTLKGKHIKDICMNESTVVALDDRGKVYTWGDNDYGQLGNGTNENSYEPICISDIEESELKDRNIQEISIKEDTIIAKDETKEILVWGRFTKNEDIKFPTPATISDTSKIVDICIDTYDYDNAILLDSNGKVYTYGDNDCGQLGDGTNNDSYYVPICISDIEGNVLKGKKIDYIYIYRNSVIVKDEQGKLYTWGYNYGGRLGNGKEYEDSNIPVCISDINGNDLKDKCIEKIDIIEWNDVYAYIITVIDSKGNAYIWGTCSNISFSSPTCINGEENMALFNKTLKNYVTDGNGRVWITTEGKMYYIEYMVMV